MNFLNFKEFKFNIFVLLYSILAGFTVINILGFLEQQQSLQPINYIKPVRVVIAFFVFLIFLMFGSMIKIAKEKKLISFLFIFSILIIINFRIFYFSNFINYVLYYDTSSYVEFSFNILKGEVDFFRTPLYPYFIKLISFLTNTNPLGDNFYLFIAYAQMILSIIGVGFFFATLSKILKNKYIVAIGTIIFGCSPWIIQWDNCILTESLAIFLTVILFYNLVCFLKKPKILTGIFSSLIIFALIMLRPIFVFLLLIFAIFYISKLLIVKVNYKKIVSALLSLVFVAGLTLGYCGLVKKNYDIFTLSYVGNNVNKLYMVLNQNFYENENYPEISAHFNEQFSNPHNTNLVVDIIEFVPFRFTYKEISEYVKDSIRKNQKSFNEYTISKFKILARSDIAVQYNSYISEDENFKNLDLKLLYFLFPFNFGQLFLMIFATLIFVLIILIKYKRIAYFPIGLIAFIFTLLVTSIYGSMAEFSRLVLPAAPAVYFLLLYFLDLIIASFRIGGFKKQLVETSCEIKFAINDSQADSIYNNKFENLEI